jgi:acetyl esterase/lipase
MIKPYRFAVMLGLLLSLAHCSPEESNPEELLEYTQATINYKTISGVDPNLLSLDIYHFGPSTTTKPIVIYVHGGAWAVGDKANSIENKTNLFSSLGYIFVSLNYRLSPTTLSLDPNRIKFPTHNEDVSDAVKWIYDNIEAYGGDKNKMVLLGHSAGAHLVSLTGTSNLFLPARGIPLNTLKGVASIDTEGYNVTDQVNAGNETYINAFGTNTMDLFNASPIEQLSTGKSYPNFFVAKRGSATRIGLADNFISKLESVGVTVSQVTANQYDHEGINDAIGAPNETAVTEPLKIFLRTCFQ